MTLVRCACGVSAAIIGAVAQHAYGWGAILLMALLAVVVLMFITYSED